VLNHKIIFRRHQPCKLCKIDIEDECHFLLKCPKFEIERKEFLKLISKEYKNVNSLEVNNKFIWLMSSEDDFVIQHLYKLLCNLNIKKQYILADTASTHIYIHIVIISPFLFLNHEH
jgi:hypothetical protein